jgi:hypothetical protein
MFGQRSDTGRHRVKILFLFRSKLLAILRKLFELEIEGKRHLHREALGGALAGIAANLIDAADGQIDHLLMRRRLVEIIHLLEQVKRGISHSIRPSEVENITVLCQRCPALLVFRGIE